MHIIFWLEDLKGEDYLEEKGISGRIVSELILDK
jgi:hypothetical protein